MAVVLLDIDGVLNPLGSLANHPAGNTFFSYGARWANWRISAVYHEPMLSEILEWGHEIIWISSWQEESNLYCRAMGLDEFPHRQILPGANSRKSFKTATIMSFLSQNPYEKVAIIDDDLSDEDMEYLNSRKDTLAIRPNADLGYMQEEHERVMQFLNERDN